MLEVFASMDFIKLGSTAYITIIVNVYVQTFLWELSCGTFILDI